jgi:hypothetical protein
MGEGENPESSLTLRAYTTTLLPIATNINFKPELANYLPNFAPFHPPWPIARAIRQAKYFVLFLQYIDISTGEAGEFFEIRFSASKLLVDGIGMNRTRRVARHLRRPPPPRLILFLTDKRPVVLVDVLPAKDVLCREGVQLGTWRNFIGSFLCHTMMYHECRPAS